MRNIRLDNYCEINEIKDRRVRIGVIGAGKMGQNHLRILSEMNGLFDLSGFYDPDEEKSSLADIYGTKYYKNAEELLSVCDAVTIACPTTLHKEMAMKAADKDVHALVEKPIAESVSDAEEIIDKFIEHGLRFTVGYVERFNPVIRMLADILKDMEIVAVEVHRCSPYDPRIYDVDVISDLMIHDIDIIVNALMDDEPKEIAATSRTVYTGNFADYANASLFFRNARIPDGGRVNAYITTSRVTEDKIRSICIHAKGAYVEGDMLTKTLRIKRGTSSEFVSRSHATYRQSGITENVIVPQVEPLREELRNFGNAVLGKEELIVTVPHVLRSMKVLERIKAQIYGGIHE